DLYYRLGVIQIKVPPLREHSEDIPALVDYFLEKLAADGCPRARLTDAAMAKIRAYSWPGNIRQLRAVLENALVMSEGDTIDAHALLLPAPRPPEGPPTLNLEELEVWAIRRALEQTGGKLGQAAQLLGIVRETLANKRRKYKIDAGGEE